jgi:hypothetical protein
MWILNKNHITYAQAENEAVLSRHRRHVEEREDEQSWR